MYTIFLDACLLPVRRARHLASHGKNMQRHSQTDRNEKRFENESDGCDLKASSKPGRLQMNRVRLNHCDRSVVQKRLVDGMYYVEVEGAHQPDSTFIGSDTYFW